MVDRIPRVLSIAGSDSGGGAGIQADLKAFSACGAHGMTAVTAITAQNTTEVLAIHAVPPEVIIAQVRAVQSDIGIDAVKVGMLGDVETIHAVTRALDGLPADTPVVVDPVMVAESGAELLESAAVGALIELMLPRATVVTPNLPEAHALLAHGRREGRDAHEQSGRDAGEQSGRDARPPSGRDARPPDTDDGRDPDVAELARAIRGLGPEIVVVTGGHREEGADVFHDGTRTVEIPGVRYPDGAAHGSGCTHSSVLAARLAWGDDPLTAARTAREMAARAVRDGLDELGAGSGPVNVLGIGVAGLSPTPL